MHYIILFTRTAGTLPFERRFFFVPNLGSIRDDFKSKNNVVWYESFHKNVFGTIILYSLTSNTYAIVLVVRICSHVLYS